MRNNPIYIALLFAEAVLAFAVGVFGNKVADLLNISAGLIIVGAILVILLLYILTIVRLRYETGKRILPMLPTPGLKTLALNTAITMFPVGIGGGILFSVLSILWLPGRPLHLYFSRFSDYELVAFLIGGLFLFLIARRNPNRLLIITFAFGYALGSAATVLLLEPYTNRSFYTFLGTVIPILIVAIVVSSRPFIWFTRRFQEIITSSHTGTR